MRKYLENLITEKGRDLAIHAANQYIDQNNLIVDDATLARMLMTEVLKDIPTAMDDAKEALDANMGQIAEATFSASMRLSGINAVKKIIG